MKFIVKFFPEITIKSRPVRLRQIKQLRQNIRRILSYLDDRVRVISRWDLIEVETGELSPAVQQEMAAALGRIPGIGYFIEVAEFQASTLEEILTHTLAIHGPRLKDKTFVVRAKRAGTHDFTSHEMEKKIGGGLLHLTEARGVDLHHPDVTVKLELRDDRLFVVHRQHPGLGGFPLGSQETVLSLISGGYDSGVASYLTQRRGLRTHYCFFNLGGIAHEVGVRQVSHYLWQRYGASHSVLFVSVPFEGVVAEILAKVHHSQRGVVLKRMMLRAADRIAADLRVAALITGESVAQVSSQTLTNLAVIDQATDRLVLRPLSTLDKATIIDLAREIGTEAFARTMPEYCGVISDRPTTRASLKRIESEEAAFDGAVLEDALARRTQTPISQVMAGVAGVTGIEVFQTPSLGDVLIDIRHPEEQASRPLRLTSNRVIAIPFYELSSRATELDQGQRYGLYCAKGVMSQMHGATLSELGFENIYVYAPTSE